MDFAISQVNKMSQNSWDNQLNQLAAVFQRRHVRQGKGNLSFADAHGQVSAVVEKCALSLIEDGSTPENVSEDFFSSLVSQYVHVMCGK